jgi:hypothetical protein
MKKFYKPLFTIVVIFVISCGKSHPQYVYVPGNSLMSGHPVSWEIALQAEREYLMQFGMNYEKATREAEKTLSTYKSADNEVHNSQ